jgi:hypothetical protein
MRNCCQVSMEMGGSIEGLYCKRPIQCLASSVTAGDDTLAVWTWGGGSIVRKTPDTALYSIYVSTLWVAQLVDGSSAGPVSDISKKLVNGRNNKEAVNVLLLAKQNITLIFFVAIYSSSALKEDCGRRAFCLGFLSIFFVVFLKNARMNF